MAVKFGRLFNHLNRFNNKRNVSQYYPIDEYIFGLTNEQIQVSL